MMRMFVFFFFQAEDGIRDIGVTGVQTCALPIFTPSLIRRGEASIRKRWRWTALHATGNGMSTTCTMPPDVNTSIRDRKSTRLNSSHANISYAVFCLKKKTNIHIFLPLPLPICPLYL